MWNGKMKALTFSYDDAVTSDERLIAIFNKYGMKSTFNVNSGTLVHENQPRKAWRIRNQWGYLTKFYIEELPEIYKGHEVAAHGYMHRNLANISRAECEADIADDIAAIEEMMGYRPAGMAYANGGYSDMAVEVIREHGLRYARTVNASYSFDRQTDLLRFHPTCRHRDPRLMQLAERFASMEPETPQIFYIWGHSEEFDHDGNWDLIERFCDFFAGRDDIFFGTNKEVLLGIQSEYQQRFSAEHIH